MRRSDAELKRLIDAGVKMLRSKGGFLTHVKPDGQRAALCGYAPSSLHSRLMRQRARWMQEPGRRDCKKCREIFEHLATSVTFRPMLPDGSLGEVQQLGKLLKAPTIEHFVGGPLDMHINEVVGKNVELLFYGIGEKKEKQ